MWFLKVLLPPAGTARVNLKRRSTMPSFYIPISGLDADSTALNTIANNLSNMNTTGFKEQTTNFSDLFYQQLGSNGAGDSIQQGTGVQVASNSTDFTAGSISSTGVSTDAALDGTGYFILDNGNGSQLYTRAGDFQLSAGGQLETTSGQAVMGYSATNGTVNTTGGLTDLTVPTGTVMKPSATTSFDMTQNLNSSASVGTTTSGEVQVYDSLGKTYDATVTYTKTAANTWSYAISMPDTLTPATNVVTTAGVPTTTDAYTFGSSISNGTTIYPTVNTGTNLTITGTTATGTATITAPTVTAGETIDTYVTALQGELTAAGITGATVTETVDGAGNANGFTVVGTDSNFATSGSVVADPNASTAATGTLTFDANGNLLTPASDVSGVSFSGLSDGAATVNMNWQLFGTTGTGNISQTAAASSTSSTTQNGYASGEYESFSINTTGVIAAKYSNGQTQYVGQLAIATVNNEQGLDDVGSTEYQTTASSGQASIGVAGAGGRGTIEGSSLEASNVNISSEFSDLIVAQRAFEANSKAITTFDTVTQETINMIH
jgi:flagellar hook protein FlgE